MATGLDFNIPARALAGQYDPSETIGQQFRLKSLMQQQQMQQTQFDQQQQDREDRRSLRGLVGQYVTGSPEQRGAVMPQIAGIDPDAAVRLMDWSQKASDAEKAAVLQAQKNIAAVTESLRSLPQEQRAEALQRFAPGLIQRGATPEMLSGLDLSDSGLDVLRNQAIGITGVIEQGNKDRTYALDTAKFGYQQQNDATNRAVTLRGQDITMRGQDMVDARAQQAAGVNKPPAGYRFTSDGNLEAIPGGPADKSGKMDLSRNNAITAAENVIGAVDKALEQTGFFTTGLIGKALGSVAGTDAYNLENTINTIKANIGFDRLQQMRDASPTGGALGQVAIQELAALQSSIASLDRGQNEAQLRENLNKVKTHYENWKNAVTQAQNSERSPTSAPEDPLGLR